jgi:predicted dehydrogenase
MPPKSFALTALRQQSVTSKNAVTTWRAKPAYHGSYILDGGIHFVALLRAILGASSTVPEGENDRSVRGIHSVYEERSVVDVAACGVCRCGAALGTFHIRYGAFVEVLCRLDVYWDDAAMSIVQHKGVGYEVAMTGRETQRFGFEGLDREFVAWLDSVDSGVEVTGLSPEEALADLVVVEAMCGTKVEA